MNQDDGSKLGKKLRNLTDLKKSIEFVQKKKPKVLKRKRIWERDPEETKDIVKKMRA